MNRPGNTTGRAARELKPHGTTARAQGRRRSGIPPCTCEPCVTALRRYQNRRQALTALGHPGIVPAARSARHVRALAEAGATWRQITKTTGISQGTLANLLREDAWQRTVTVTTQERVLAVPLPARRTSGDRRVDAAGTRRRLQALQRIGWSCTALAQHSPLSAERLRKVLRARRVSVGTRAEVRRLFALLECTPGASRECARRAARKGWFPPFAWEGVDVDNPDARPELGGDRVPRPLVIAEEAEFVRRTSGVEDCQVIADRLGLSVPTLKRNLERAKALTRAEQQHEREREAASAA